MSRQSIHAHLHSAIVLFTAQALTNAWAGDPISFQELTQLPQPAPVAAHHYGPDALQFGELRLPDDSPQHDLPVVVIIHGGCWFSEYDMGHIRPLAQAITDLGYATWTLEYRRIGDAGGGWPGTLNDVAAGTDYLHQLAEEYPLDLDAVIALGHSAGGQLALWLASRDQFTAEHPLYRAMPLPIHGVLGLAAAADLDRLAAGGECDQAASKLMEGSPQQYPERYQAASPQRRVPLGVPQILINGAEDQVWSPIADSYFVAAQAAGDPVVRWVVTEAAHFDLVAPLPPAWPYLEQALSELAEKNGHPKLQLTPPAAVESPAHRPD